MPALMPRNPATVGPGKLTIAEAQNKDLKMAFMSKLKVLKEEMKKSAEEIYEHSETVE